MGEGTVMDYWVQEDGTSRWVLEDGSGFWIIEALPTAIARAVRVVWESSPRRAVWTIGRRVKWRRMT